MARPNLKILLTSGVIVGALGYLMVTSLSDAEALTYFHPVDEVLVQPTKYAGQKIRTGGHVLEGSIFNKPGTLEYQFDVKPIPAMMKHPQVANKTITVRYTGVVPDTFKDGNEVIVTGVLQPDGTFLAKELLAKCPSKYEAGEKNNGTY